MQYVFDAFGSRLEILLKNEKNDSGISESFWVVRDFERKYSRFQKWNILSEINSSKQAILEPEILSLIRLCLRVSKLTGWFFDITILPVLENLWYGIVPWKLRENIGYENIILSWNRLTLKNNVNIEFGSFGKWYMLDVIHNILQKYHSEYSVIFWWDMRVVGNQKVLLEDPRDTTKYIWEISLRNLSLASSAWNRRKFWNSHHLINAKDKASQNEILGVYVTHKLGVFADIFATALFVTPLEKTLKILEQVDGLEALIISKDGKIYKSKWFTGELSLLKNSL